MWETSNSVQSGTNMVYHAAGWLEGGLIASPEKFIMDCEVIQMIQRYMDPQIVATTPDDIAIDAIREVGSGGHHFGIEHTQDRYENALYARSYLTGAILKHGTTASRNGRPCANRFLKIFEKN